MASDKMIVIADSSKKVAELGSFPLPVEVIRYGCELTKIQVVQYLTQNGYKDPQVMYRTSKDKRFITDEGNFILDLHLNFISDEATLSNDLNLIPGVVENGLFVNICKCVVLRMKTDRSLSIGKKVKIQILEMAITSTGLS